MPGWAGTAPQSLPASLTVAAEALPSLLACTGMGGEASTHRAQSTMAPSTGPGNVCPSARLSEDTLPQSPFILGGRQMHCLIHSRSKSALCQGHIETGEGCTCCQGVRASAKGPHGKERKTDLQSRSLERVLSCRCKCSPSGQRMYQPGAACCRDATSPYETQTNCTTHRNWQGPGEFSRNDFADDGKHVLAGTV